ncbi:trypsin 3A1-like [Pseudomyrmex gracilis]|uniref:trypsin 3A1-like n=1 Tax=Pseudomyrmex gracilis TaxID=219809 RepID=UPI000995445A|nr:trypsin 3A1-like [Pseudomyrmex gracilis]
MDAKTRRALAIIVCLSNIYSSSAFGANFRRNLPIFTSQVHYNLTNADVTIDKTPYTDFETFGSSSEKLNVCDDCVCGVARHSRIVGGNVTSVHEYPWLVSMYKRGTFYCAGSVITRKHVLTAAHCLSGFDIKSITLVLVDADHPKIGKSAIVRGIHSVTIHENYQAYSYDNDIAIIQMDQPVIIGDAIRTACLPEDKNIDYTGANATIVGWGRTGEHKPLSDELRRVNVPILSMEECALAGYAKDRITENMFCSGFLQGEFDACFGDSGGPLLVKGVHGQLDVIGLVSFGRGCARPSFPGIYTKLTNYIDWFKDHLHGECVCHRPHQRVN